MIAFENFYLQHIGDYDYFKIELGTLAIPFTLFSVLFLINSFNYFDGLDGTLIFSSISTFTILYYLTNDEIIKLFLILILIPCIIFLFFNFSFIRLPKLFLGDSGSLLLGFITSFLLISIAKKGLVHPILLAWSVVIFVYEFLSLNIIRLSNKKGIFIPSKDHLHHLIFRKSKSIFLTNTTICFLNIFLFLIGNFSFKFFGSAISLILFILLFIIFLILRKKLNKKTIINLD